MKYTDRKTGEVWDANWYGEDFIITREKPMWRQLALPAGFARKLLGSERKPTTSHAGRGGAR